MLGHSQVRSVYTAPGASCGTSFGSIYLSQRHNRRGPQVLEHPRADNENHTTQMEGFAD